MPFTERLMGIGGWSLPLIRNLPRDVRAGIDINDDDPNAFATVFVTDGWVDVRHMDTVSRFRMVSSDMVRWGGIYRHFEGGAMSGPGIAAWMGDEKGYGPHVTYAATGPMSFSAHLAFLTMIGFNLAPDLVGAGPGGTMEWETPVPSPTTREALDHICRFFGAEWKTHSIGGNWFGDIDAGLASDLYGATPLAMLSDTGTGWDRNIRALNATFDVVKHVDDWYSEVVISAGGFPAVDNRTNNYVVPVDPSPPALGLDDWQRVILDNSTTAADLTTQAAQYIAYDGLRATIANVTTNAYDPVKDAGGVGMDVFVWSLEHGLWAVNEGRAFRGEWTLPTRLRLVGATTPFRRGMGVYMRRGDDTYTDLTPYVDYDAEPKQATLEVGASLQSWWARERQRFEWQG